jgi:hypothetical protein
MPQLSRREFAAAAASLSPPVTLAARPQGKRPENLLTASWTPEKLARVLAAPERWKPFPAAAERTAWEGLPQATRKALLESAQRNLGADWPGLPATLFLEYARTGNRSRYERVRNVRRERLREAVIAECVESKERFLDEVANGIWETCEETFWGVPAHLSLQKAGSGLPDVAEPVVDLFAAETSSLLAWTDYLLGARLEKVSPLIRKRVRAEIGRRILTPCFERTDFWWMGLDPKGRRNLNNWTPWIDSNWLTSVLLIESDPKRRVAAVHKIMRSLDAFLASYHDDGGCDEGPGYWSRAGASLFDCLELLHSASNGAIDFYRVPLVREIGRYIYRAHIAGDWFVNFADASARLHPAGDLIFRYGRRIGDTKLQAFGAWAAAGADGSGGDSIGRQLPALFNLAAIAAAPDKNPPLVRDVWLPGIQVMAARRKEGSADGLYLAAQGGHNAESHNHNDVGNFIVYAGGKPAIVDVGVETYTAKTFSSRRYEIWTMQSAYHNLPTVDGVMQGAGREFAATDVGYEADDRAAEFALNIEKAFPAEAGIENWRRRLRLDRAKNEVLIADRYSLAKPAKKITLTLMTPCAVKPGPSGEIAIGDVKVVYDGNAMAPVVEEIRLEDSRLRSTWGERMYRVLLVAENPPARGEFNVRIVQG